MIRRTNSTPQAETQPHRANRPLGPAAAPAASGRFVGRAIACAVMGSLAALAACDGALDAGLTPGEGTVGVTRQASTSLFTLTPSDLGFGNSSDFHPDSPHRFSPPTGGTRKDKLVVFLPGQDMSTASYETFLSFAASRGYHAIGLSYWRFR